MFAPIYFLFLAAVSVKATSLPKMRDMISLENKLLQNFRQYAKELEEKLNIIDKALDDYKETMAEAEQDPELYLSNPINAFRLMRHMHQDWTNWQIYMKKQVGSVELKNMESLLLEQPQTNMFKDAVNSLQSITKFYQYEPSFLLNQDEFNSDLHLSPLDCYHMGMELYRQHKYFEAAEWLSAAADNYNVSQYSHIYSILDVPHWKIYEMHSKVLKNLNRRNEALKALNAAIHLEPHNVDLLQQQRDLDILIMLDTVEPLTTPVTKTSQIQMQCQGKFPFGRELSCEYNTMVTPFLELAPLKLEEVLYGPYTMVYHDIVYENEILHMKKIFQTCRSSDKFTMSEGRINGCSINDLYSKVTTRINERTKDMTGLNRDMKNLYIMEYSQLQDAVRIFQLLKRSRKFAHLDFNDIEATVIIFLNDVKVGGAITLQNQPMIVYPRQGDALVTFNEGDFEHIICPNVVGSGLVILKFFYNEDE